MAFPVNLNAANPPQSESPSLGAGRIRAIIQNLIDLFNLPASTDIAAALTITRLGPYTNNSGVTLVAGDVVAVDAGANTSVVLDDTLASLRPFVVCLTASVVNAATGVFGQVGQVTVTTQGAVTRGHYLVKSATTKAVEDSGVAVGSTVTAPAGALGIALTAAAGPGAGTCVAQMFASPERSTPSGGSLVRGLVGQNNSGTPNTQFDLTSADLVVLRRPSDGSLVVRTAVGLLTNDITQAQAANGRDQAGAFTASTFIHFYYIWNGTTLATLSSATGPPTGPTLPTGYTHWAYAGAVRYNATPLLVRTRMRGAWMTYDAHVNLVNAGAPAAGVETSVDASAALPANTLTYLIDAFFTVVDDTTSGFNFKIRLVTGSDYADMRGVVAVGTQTGAVQGPVLLPNVGRSFFYLWGVDGGTPSSPAASIFVQGYKVGNGDA